jgi:3-hydroxypropanoate dehydrogenase
VPDAQLQQLYELLKWGPTSANSSPARFVFVRTSEAKAQLAACVSPANQPKVLSAPVTAIIGMDMAFYEQLPTLFPHTDARAWFLGNDALIASTAMRNSSLQGGYLIMAARALGLGCGPMSGMDTTKVDAAFFAGSTVKTNFVCTLGHGDPAKVMARSPRLTFEQACQLV